MADITDLLRALPALRTYPVPAARTDALFDRAHPTPPHELAAAIAVCQHCVVLARCRAWVESTPAPPVSGVAAAVYPPPPRRRDPADAWMAAELASIARRRTAPPVHPHARRDEGVAWLRAQLGAGSADCGQLLAAAAADGIPRHQIFRARATIGDVHTEHHGLHSTWSLLE